jgi:hypothetical protein
MRIKQKAFRLEQVNAALRKYISVDKMTLIYAGDFIRAAGNL